MNRIISQLRLMLLPAESPQELAFRTLYHRLNATRFFVHWQMRKATESYRVWRQEQKTNQQYPKAHQNQTSVLFVLSIRKGMEENAHQTLRSLLELGQDNWKVLPVIEAGINTQRVPSQNDDERILAPVMSNDLQRELIEQPSAFFLICSAGDLFNPHLLEYFQQAITDEPDAVVFYYDCEYKNQKTGEYVPLLKSSAVSPEMMLSINYLSRGFIKSDHLKNLSQGSEKEVLPEVYEFQVLSEIVQQESLTYHMAVVLAQLETLEQSQINAMDNEISLQLSKKTGKVVSIQHPGGYRKITWQFDEPRVSLIILNHNHGTMLKAFLESIYRKTIYSNYSICIVDNQSTEKDTLTLFQQLEHDSKIHVVHYDEVFNYSTAVNIGVANTTGEVIVILNNDMLIEDDGWLHELVQWALLPEIGVVGGKLLHKNRSIQHAGIILGMNGFIGHLYLNAPEQYHGLAGSVNWYRNYYALTGACQAMRREVFEKVGGYDERFRLAFGDIDFCLRVIKAGYRNLYTPHARLIHFEGGSRGYDTPTNDILLGYEELKPWLERNDPHFSPLITYSPIPQMNLRQSSVNDRIEKIEQRKRSLLG